MLIREIVLTKPTRTKGQSNTFYLPSSELVERVIDVKDDNDYNIDYRVFCTMEEKGSYSHSIMVQENVETIKVTVK